MTRRALALAGFLLMFAAPAAEAGEAFVMWFEVSSAWYRDQYSSHEGWQPQFTYLDLGECKDNAVAMLRSTEARFRSEGMTGVTRNGQAVEGREPDGLMIRVIRACLPATIDPRPR
jgi:hypothetical protein